MIIVTGGAGFIGSRIIRNLNRQGISNILVVDKLKDSKLKNLASLNFLDFLDVDSFYKKLNLDSFYYKPKSIFHIGACSDTTETDGEYLLKNNYETSKILAEFAIKNSIRFVYASSASVYGLGESGFREELNCESPINLYAFTKWQFDQYIRQRISLFTAGCIGLRYFNVYGLGEEHKGNMASPVYKFRKQIEENGYCQLFKSYGGYSDGNHLRDFIYIKDIVQITLWSMFNTNKSGIFNVGTSTPRSFNDIAKSIINELGFGEIKYVDFPDKLIGKYQSYTSADITKLKEAGYRNSFYSIESGIKDIFSNHE